jgi:hypothetical protein
MSSRILLLQHARKIGYMEIEKTKHHNINLIVTLGLVWEIWSVSDKQAVSPASMQNESSPEKSVSKWLAKMIQTENS